MQTGDRVRMATKERVGEKRIFTGRRVNKRKRSRIGWGMRSRESKGCISSCRFLQEGKEVGWVGCVSIEKEERAVQKQKVGMGGTTNVGRARYI